MASIRKQLDLAAAPDAVWAAFRDVGAVHTRLAKGFVTDCRMDGPDRIVTFINEMVAREVIVNLDDEARRLVYGAHRSATASQRVVHCERARQRLARGVGGRLPARRDRAGHRGDDGAGRRCHEQNARPAFRRSIGRSVEIEQYATNTCKKKKKTKNIASLNQFSTPTKALLKILTYRAAASMASEALCGFVEAIPPGGCWHELHQAVCAWFAIFIADCFWSKSGFQISDGPQQARIQLVPRCRRSNDWFIQRRSRAHVLYVVLSVHIHNNHHQLKVTAQHSFVFIQVCILGIGRSKPDACKSFLAQLLFESSPQR